MLVEMWMSRDPITILPTASIAEAALLMVRHRVRRLMVTDREQADARVVGIVSAGDVGRAFPADLNPFSAAVTERSVPGPVAAIMTHAVHTIAADAPIEEAARLLRAHKIGALPVMRGTRLVGVVTESDVFRAFVEMSDAGRPGVRVTFELDEDEELLPTLVPLCDAHRTRVASVFSFHHRDARSGDLRRLGIVRLDGDAPQEFLDALWKSRHRVLAVAGCPTDAG